MAASTQDTSSGGYGKIHQDLLRQLGKADLLARAAYLRLPGDKIGEVEVPFLGCTDLVSNHDVRLAGGQTPSVVTKRVLIRYVLHGRHIRPAGRFIPLAELAGPLFKQGGYSTSALARPMIRQFQDRVSDLLLIAALVGVGGKGQGGYDRSASFLTCCRAF